MTNKEFFVGVPSLNILILQWVLKSTIGIILANLIPSLFFVFMALAELHNQTDAINAYLSNLLGL